MKIGLFAARQVGWEVAAFLGSPENEAPACLVLDDRDEQWAARIAAACGIDEPARIHRWSSLSREEGVDALRGLDLDLIILAWWPYILKEPLLSLPRLGCLNFHPSFLPHGRGRNYNFWTLVEGGPFGVTLHWVDAGIDSGDIAFQRGIEKTWEDTGRTLYERAQREIVGLFKECYPRIRAGEIPRVPQDPAAGSYHRGAELEPASRIDLDATVRARDLLNLLRARTFAPHPAAWFVEDGRKYEVRVEIRAVSQE